ncbi:MAG: lipid-A-disaccharide synthase-related protein [Synechococcaceae cyanobacterium]|nr:lipid-A-disaccharide synthase-related protein [Synechococcaceae cyanobacterium]
MSAPAPRLLLLSNGHGEDLSGSMLALALRQRGVQLEALPLVGHGQSYRRVGVPVIGPTREYSTGGLGYTSLRGYLRDLFEGQPLYVLGRLVQLWRRRRRYDLVVAVGDLVPVLAASISQVPSVVYLVAYSSHYEGRLRLPWPCSWLLRNGPFREIWSRDALTAADLSQQLGRSVRFLGNPFLDPVAPTSPMDDPAAIANPRQAPDAATPDSPTATEDAPAPLLALFPGSRLPEALTNLRLMLQVLNQLPAPWRTSGALRLQAALVSGLDRPRLLAMAEPLGWRPLETGPERQAPPQALGDSEASSLVLGREGLRLELHWGRFSTILAACDLVLAMAGTASEQAVGLAKPVVQLVGPGPQFTAGFAEAQRRLLGPGVNCAAGSWGSRASLAGTAELLSEQLARGRAPASAASWRRQLETIAAERIGAPGGSSRMAEAILAALQAAPTSEAPRSPGASHS